MVNVRLVNPASLTLEEVSRRQKKAVEFTRHVAKDAALADELEALTPEQYAKRKGFRLENPSKDEKENEMVTTDQKLIQKIEELCDSNRQLAEMIRRSQSVATEVSRRAKSSTRRVSNPNGDETQSEVTPLRAVSAERRVKRVSAD